MVKVRCVFTYGLDNLRMAMPNETAHLARCPVKYPTAVRRIDVRPIGMSDDLFVELGRILNETSLCCLLELDYFFFWKAKVAHDFPVVIAFERAWHGLRPEREQIQDGTLCLRDPTNRMLSCSDYRGISRSSHASI